MTTKWDPGSAGEKEAKQHKVIAAFLAVVTIGVLLILFVIPNDVRENVKAAPSWLNIIGALLVLASAGSVIRSFTAGEEGAKNYAVWWVVLLALGILTAAGFFGYTY